MKKALKEKIKKMGVSIVYIFGSRATDTTTPLSDIQEKKRKGDGSKRKGDGSKRKGDGSKRKGDGSNYSHSSPFFGLP